MNKLEEYLEELIKIYKEANRKNKESQEKNHKDLIATLINIGYQIQEIKKILNNFYNDFVFFNRIKDSKKESVKI